MKKLIASAGLVALGAASLKAQYAPGLTRMETSKPWSVSASLRGFYDDNYLALPSALSEEADTSSFGFEVKPRVALNLSREATYLGAAYTYTAKWYEDRPDDKVDQAHEVDLKAEHRFSDRLKASFNNSFVYAEEPEIEAGFGVAQTVFLRTDAEVMRNRASVDGTVQLTELFGLGLGYQNSWYDYVEDEELIGSRSDLLDRLEHVLRLDTRWQARPELVGLLGYQFRLVDYTGDEAISIIDPDVTGEIRNQRIHYAYVGGEYQLSEELAFQGRVGGSFTEFTEVDDDDFSPYADLSGTYTYLPGSYLTVGFRHDRNPTDVFFALDQESSVVYGTISHRITPVLTANLLAQYQHSAFEGDAADDAVDNVFYAGANLQYHITPNWSAETGYNYDRLDSDFGNFRSYSRNRVYVGVRAAY